MNDNDTSRSEYVKGALLEARNEQQLKSIERNLIAQGIPEGTITAIKSELKKKGLLNFQHVESYVPIKIGSKDVIPPEAELERIQLQDGEYKMGFVDGIRVMIMAARYNQLLAASQAEMVKTQLEVMSAAKSESEQVAAKAAMAVGEQVIDFIAQSQKQKADIATVERPMEGMLARVMESCFTNLMKAMFPGMEINMPGITKEKRKREA